MSLSTLKDLQHIPGSRGLPYFGHFFPFIKNASKFWKDQQDKYGDIFKYTTPMGTAVVLLGPTANKFILVEQGKFASNKEAWETSLSDLFPNGLMLMDGEKHHYHRSIMNEAFKKDPMQGYLDKMPAIISAQIDQLEGKERILAFPYFKNFTLKLAASVFFGIDLNQDLSDMNTALTNVVNAAGALPFNFPFTPYRKGLNGRKFLVAYFESIIDERRSHPGTDLFSRLCQAKSEEGNQFTDQEIIDHLIFVLMAAHDTTAITLSLMSYFLAKDQDWQKEVRSEAEILENLGTLKVADLRKLEKTGLVIKETLRLHPPLTMVARKLEKELEVGDYKLPQNTLVNVVFQMTQTDKRIWTNPSIFDPERFSTERKEHLKCPFAYAPFGAGKHHCIGYAFAEMQVKLVIVELLKRYKISVPEGYECPIRDVPLKQPKDDLPLYLEKIVHNS